MCGLVGIIGPSLSIAEKGRFTELFFINVMRGAHGCGLIKTWTDYSPKSQYWYHYNKDIMPSSEFVYTEDYERFLKGTGFSSIMGHSRHATVGKIEEENNHPFEAGNLIGMHNGTIRGSFEGSKNFSTDSEALYNLINKHGLKKALGIVYKEANSVAYALAYYDKSNHSMTLIKNDERPLWIAKKSGVHYYASERRFLDFTLGTDSVEIERVPSHCKITFDLGSPTKVPKVVKDFIDPKDYVKSYSYTQYFSGNNNNKNRGRANTHVLVWNRDLGRMVTKEEDERFKEQKARNSLSNKDKKESKTKKPVTENFLDDPSMVTMWCIPPSSYFSEHMLLKQINATGCVICSETISDPSHIRYTKGSEPICEGCRDKLKDYGIDDDWDELKKPHKIQSEYGKA